LGQSLTPHRRKFSDRSERFYAGTAAAMVKFMLVVCEPIIMPMYDSSAAKDQRAARRQFILAALLVFLHVIRLQPALAVPAPENESVVVAEVLERTIVDASVLGIEPAQKLWRFKLRLVSVESAAGAENFLDGQAGQTIEVYSNEVNAPAATAKRVTVRIRFQGDERAGRYWIVETIDTRLK
jgi:hypothetical protein